MNIKRIENIDIIEGLLRDFESSFYYPISKNKKFHEYANKLYKNACVYVCEDHENTLGLLIFYANRKDFSFLTSIAVKRDYQGMGYGNELLRFFLRYSQNKGFKKMRLQVDSSNIKAINLYKKYGFKFEKELESHYMYRDI